MARLSRLIFPAAVHYVLLSGVQGLALFKDAHDYSRMLSCLYEQAVREDVLIHAFALLSNEVHVLVTPRTVHGLPKMMQGIGRSYVRYYNARYERAGTLWAARYKASLVQPGAWLKRCLVYLDILPQALNAANEAARAEVFAAPLPREHAWSSYWHYTGQRGNVFLSAPAEIWDLGNTPFAREEQYVQLVQNGLSAQEYGVIAKALRGGWIIGDNAFIDSVQALSPRRVTKSKPGRPSVLAQPRP